MANSNLAEADFSSFIPEEGTVDFSSFIPKKESVPTPESWGKKTILDHLSDIGIGFQEATKGEAAAGRMTAATVGGLAVAPVAGIAGLAKTVTSGVTEGGKTLEEIGSIPGKLIQTPEEAKILEDTVGLAMKPVTMAGEGLKEIVRLTPLKDTIAEPIAGTIGEASAMFGLPTVPKRVLKTPTLRERIVETKVNPTNLRDQLIREGVDPKIAVEAELAARKRGLTALMEERKIVEADRPYVERFKESQGIAPGSERLIKNLEPVNRGFTLGEVPRGVREFKPELLEAPEPVPRPMGGDERLALPPGEGFITDHASINAPLTSTSPFATTGRRQIEQKKDFVVVSPKEGQRQLPFEPGEIVGRGSKEGEGFVVENTSIDTTPKLNWQGKPFKTEASAEKSALKAGVAADSFEVIPSGKGFAYRLLDTRPRPIDTTGQVTEPVIKTQTVPTEEEVVPEVSKSDTMAETIKPEEVEARKAADDAGVRFKGLGDFDGKSYALYEDPLTNSSFTLLEGEAVADALVRSRKPFIESGELDLSKVEETPKVDTTSVLEKLLGLPESKPVEVVQSLRGKLGKIIEDINEYSATGEKIDQKLLDQGETFANTLSPIEQAKFRFGTTKDLTMAGFITPDGSGLDFGTGVPGNPRFAHGRMIQVYKDSRGITAPRKALEDGMVRLAIDGKWDQGYFEVGGPLTEQQINFISDNWKDSGFNKIYLDYIPKVLQDSRTILHSEPATAENIKTLLEDVNKNIIDGKKEVALGPEKGIVEGSGLLYTDGTSKRLPAGHEKVEKTPDTLRTSTTDKEVIIDITLGVDPTPAQLDAIEGMIGKRRDVRIGVYKPSGKYMTGGIVESPKDVMRFVNEAKGKTFPPEGTDGTILNSGFDPIAAVNSLKATVEDVASLLPHLENLGKYTYEKGKTKYFEWQKEIKSLLGDMWERFKIYIADVWKRVSSGKVGVLKNQRGSVGKDIKKGLKHTGKDLDVALGAITTRLKNIHPSLKIRMRKFEFDNATKISERSERVKPLIKAKKKMSKEDRKLFADARFSGDGPELKRLVSKYGLGKEYHEFRLVDDEILEDARSVGYKVNRLPNHHPRHVKDPEGLLAHLQKLDDWSTFEYAMKKKEKSLGRDLSPEERIKVVNTMLRGYSTGNVTLSKPGQLKARTIKEVTDAMKEFYSDPDNALLKYIRDVTTAVEGRRLFGIIKDKKTFDFENTIGGYVAKLLDDRKINYSQERELREIIKDRFNIRGTSGIVQVYKNISYIELLGSIISGIRQASDLAFTLYKFGIPTSVSSLSEVLTNKSPFSVKTPGLDRIAAEFSDEGITSKAVSKVFDNPAVGVTNFDSVGKETYMLSAYKTALEKLKTPKGEVELRKELQPIFEGDTNKVIADLKSGKITRDINFYVSNALAEVQPIYPSESPALALTSGNFSILYMLNRFTLKMFDVFRNDAFQKIKTKGERVQGIKNLIKLASYLIIGNAAADVVQDFILGKDIELSDLVVDNLWRMIGTSKYAGRGIEREGAGTALLMGLLPPVQLINSLSKDIMSFGDGKGWETTKSIPLFGKIVYYRFGKGKDKLEEKRQKKNKEENKAPTLNSLRNLHQGPKLNSLKRH